MCAKYRTEDEWSFFLIINVRGSKIVTSIVDKMKEIADIARASFKEGRNRCITIIKGNVY